jgi:hypothetical protein
MSHYRCHHVFVPLTSRLRTSDTLDRYPDPLFPFEGSPSSPPPPDPYSPQIDGLDLVSRLFRDPDLDICTVLGPGQAVFLQPLTGNLHPGPRISDGLQPALLYRTAAGHTEW